MKGDHPFAEHHGTGRPGDDRHLVGQVQHFEQAQAVEKRQDVAAGDRQRLAAAELLGHRTAMAQQRRPRGEPHLGCESFLNAGQPILMLAIEPLNVRERRRQV